MFIHTQIPSQLRESCSKCRVIPVVIVEDVDKAVPLARALLAGGIEVIEVTLRTPAALDAIKEIRKSVPDIYIGAGTLLHPKQVYKANKAGAHFGVSPGTTTNILDAAYDCLLPMLPGISTPSELMMWQNFGIDFFKFFPAESSGGVAFLSSLVSPFPDIQFCPTGGITTTTARQYLQLPNVSCIGGSWITPPALVQQGDWDQITELARNATNL